MIRKDYSKIDVVTATRKRLRNIFSTAQRITFSISGGKDSICLNDIMFKMCQSGEIDKSRLEVDFVDEEAIYPCVERIALNMRLQWISIGVKFNWWCVQVKHFNCLNQLASDESFICWDERKKDVWIRKRPAFAITSHPLLEVGKDNYQMLFDKLNKGKVNIVGVRASESVQRYSYLAKMKSQDKIYPIYDWKDTDVWQYIRDNNLDFPDAYKYMYQVGVGQNRMRISQFFSVDTIAHLVNMCEFYPDLFDRICKREPNAYMAMLYYDTELFRRQKKSKQANPDEVIDYKEKLFQVLKEDWRFESKSMRNVKKRIEYALLKYSHYITNREYKRLYETAIAGDPKLRSIRAITMDLHGNVFKQNGGEHNWK